MPEMRERNFCPSHCQRSTLSMSLDRYRAFIDHGTWYIHFLKAMTNIIFPNNIFPKCIFKVYLAYVSSKLWKFITDIFEIICWCFHLYSVKTHFVIEPRLLLQRLFQGTKDNRLKYINFHNWKEIYFHNLEENSFYYNFDSSRELLSFLFFQVFNRS